MFSSRQIRVLAGVSQPRAPSLPQSPGLARAYALSRFPGGRKPGSGRERPSLKSSPSLSGRRDSDAYGHEEQPSAEESPLWQASQRTPASNPMEGLRKLLMENHTLVITRQLEMMNVFLGFEQTNRYVISNESGELLGFIAEEPRGLLATFTRQIFRTHRPFRALVMDAAGSPLLWLRRPFAWINSLMYVQRLEDFQEYSSQGEPVLDTFAEVKQQWHLWRRRYDLFLREKQRPILSLASDPQPEPDPELFTQFARVDEGFLAWHFHLRGARGQELGSVYRQFRGFGREIFTDTGQYFVTFGPRTIATTDDTQLDHEPASTLEHQMTLEERALTLAMAVNVDFDYFSRHSEGSGTGFLWLGSMGSE